MKMKQLVIAGCSILVLSTGAALAGPCDTGRAASLKDAGSGPAKMGDSQTTGMAGNTGQHPPTDTMNRTTGDVAASSQDTQRQMQGEPTAAQQAEGAKEGAKADSKAADKDC
ncbi:type IV secretory pathway TrbL component [Bradyrhizobium sp. AZCC 1693]